MILGYEPERVARLVGEADAAVAMLDTISSTDPAAAAALDAIATMRRALRDQLLPAARAVAARDPLANRGGFEATDSTWYSEWLRSQLGPYADWSDEEVLAELERLESEVPYDDDANPVTDGPFWDRFELLAVDLSRRAASDDEFAAELAARAASSYLIPYAVPSASFDPALVADMLREVLRTPSGIDDLLSHLQAGAAEILLRELVDHPEDALDVISIERDDVDPARTLLELIDWALLDDALVDEFLLAALSVPFTVPERLDDAHVVLRNIVLLANSDRFESGFPPATSSTFTKIVVRYLPFFVTSLDTDDVVHLKDFDLRDTGRPLGTYEELVDLVGSLLRDPAARQLMLGSLAVLAALSVTADGPLAITPEDIADLVALIEHGALNEQAEEDLRASAEEANLLFAIDLAFDMLSSLLELTGPVSDGAAVMIDLFERGTRLLVEHGVDASDVGLGGVDNAAFTLLALGLCAGFLQRHRPDDDDDDERADDVYELADEVLDDIEAMLASGASASAIDGRVDDLVRLLDQVDDDGVLDVLDDPRLRPPTYDAGDAADR